MEGVFRAADKQVFDLEQADTEGDKPSSQQQKRGAREDRRKTKGDPAGQLLEGCNQDTGQLLAENLPHM